MSCHRTSAFRWRHWPSVSREAGFTLVEMLAVIAILTVLTSLLLGTISRAKSRALSIQCQSNLRQHGIALHNFLSSHRVYPLSLNLARSTGQQANHAATFHGSLKDQGLGPFPEKQPYKGPSVHLCPAAQRQRLPASLSGEIARYGYNAVGLEGDRFPPLGLGMKSQEDPAPVTESDVCAPSNMIALGDGVAGWEERYEDAVPVLGRRSSAMELPGSTKRVRTRHAGKANVVYCDGHVGAHTLGFLFASESEPALASWNRDHEPHRERIQ